MASDMQLGSRGSLHAEGVIDVQVGLLPSSFRNASWIMGGNRRHEEAFTAFEEALRDFGSSCGLTCCIGRIPPLEFVGDRWLTGMLLTLTDVSIEFNVSATLSMWGADRNPRPWSRELPPHTRSHQCATAGIRIALVLSSTRIERYAEIGECPLWKRMR